MPALAYTLGGISYQSKRQLDFVKMRAIALVLVAFTRAGLGDILRHRHVQMWRPPYGDREHLHSLSNADVSPRSTERKLLRNDGASDLAKKHSVLPMVCARCKVASYDVHLAGSRAINSCGYFMQNGPGGSLADARARVCNRNVLVRAQASEDGQSRNLTHDAASPPATWLLMLIAGLQSACFGCIGTALPPALRASGMDPASIALLLGRMGSVSAFVEVMVSGSFGKLADAIGRKPVLLGAPAATVLLRALVVLNPSIPMLLAVRLLTTLVVPIYWLVYQAFLADCYSRNANELAVIGSRIQAAMGLGYAISSFIGGPLAAADIRYAYAASCSIGCCVLGCLLRVHETLPASRRIPFRWSGSSPFAFVRLFRRGALFTKLNMVICLQSLTNGMGDIWQVIARELRGWGAAQCGRYAAFAGISSMVGTLAIGPCIQRLGARGHTLVSTASSALTATVLGQARSDIVANGALVPLGFGAGKSQAVSARIVNLGYELGVPQGQLAAERNALNAIIKVIAPSLYASLFSLGVSHGVLGLPFYSTSILLVCSAIVAASIPGNMWQSPGASPAQR